MDGEVICCKNSWEGKGKTNRPLLTASQSASQGLGTAGTQPLLHPRCVGGGVGQPPMPRMSHVTFPRGRSYLPAGFLPIIPVGSLSGGAGGLRQGVCQAQPPQATPSPSSTVMGFTPALPNLGNSLHSQRELSHPRSPMLPALPGPARTHLPPPRGYSGWAEAPLSR